jgi:hypothetical protein
VVVEPAFGSTDLLSEQETTVVMSANVNTAICQDRGTAWGNFIAYLMLFCTKTIRTLDISEVGKNALIIQ